MILTDRERAQELLEAEVIERAAAALESAADALRLAPETSNKATAAACAASRSELLSIVKRHRMREALRRPVA